MKRSHGFRPAAGDWRRRLFSSVRQLPELFDVGVKARSLAYLFVAGALLGLLTLLLPHSEDVQDAQLYVLAAIAVAVAALVYVQAERVSEWQLHLVLGAGTTILSFANYYTGTSTLYPLLYTWTALYAFYFFSLRMALAHMAYIGLAYAVVLAIQDPGAPAIRWLLAVGTPLIAGLLFSRMLDRLRAQQIEAGESARRLSQSEARTRLVLDNSPDPFVTIDPDGIIRAWNLAAERMFGWPASEAIGKPFRALVTPPEFRDRHDARRRALVESSDPVATQTYDMELQRRDGTRFPAEATVSKVEVQGEILISGFIRDLTDRRRRQEEREALMREHAAREEAERVAELVSGMQLLVDAALAHRTLYDILSDLVTRVRGVIQADAASIHLVQDGQLALRAASDTSPAAPFTGEDFAARVAEAREPLLVQDPEPEEVASVIGVPLLADGEVGGVVVASAAPPRRFTADDLSILRLAADRVALAIEHARVYEREHNIAVTLQQSLLPQRKPHIPGLEVAWRYRPAADEAEVGGDWYDVLTVPGGGVGLVMGDVAGKGLAAASMVGRLRSGLRAYALEGHAPGRVLEQLNRLIWTEAEESQMATLVYLVVDPDENEVRWVNAGHPPPLLLNSDRRPQYLESGSSVPLGVLPFADFEEVAVPLPPDGTVVLYTDGLVERAGEHIDLGLGRLAEAVRDAPRDPEQLCDHVLSRLVPERGTPDDVALLTLRSIPMTEGLQVDVHAAPEALARMRAVLRRWLQHVGADEREITEIVTACGEAAANAIEHAGVGSGASFEVSGRAERGVAEITVRDHGGWRAPRAGDQGRGLSMMRALMDSVAVTPAPGGTTVRLERTLQGVDLTQREAPGDGAGRT
jgi:PAS domain S-box-containing protein